MAICGSSPKRARLKRKGIRRWRRQRNRFGWNGGIIIIPISGDMSQSIWLKIDREIGEFDGNFLIWTYHECIRSTPNWHGYVRRDTVLVDVAAPMMKGFVVGQVQLFFSFVFRDKEYECALINWLVPVGNAPDPDTSMWVVEVERESGTVTLGIIDVNVIVRTSHAIGVYGTSALPKISIFRTLSRL
ncbi:hypothetical protein R3P38DRAFT_2767744 [Favolaschia claudopus]|uniref:Uncharacterized protein n=1 Tax=Favolaschia claudopus TaxID=2862362 RepID=A0AAW0CTJ6_9AGAR